MEEFEDDLYGGLHAAAENQEPGDERLPSKRRLQSMLEDATEESTKRGAELETLKATGKPAKVVYDMEDRYDDAHKMTAMMRTTAFPAAIIARMLADGRIPPGAHTNETGVPAAEFFKEIAKRGFKLTRRFEWL